MPVEAEESKVAQRPTTATTTQASNNEKAVWEIEDDGEVEETSREQA